MHRRTVLAAAAAGVGTLAGCSAIGSSDGGDDPPVYGDGPDDPDHRLRLEVTVVDDGSPVADETVVYHDYGGSYDRLEGTTDDEGRLVFVDSMGPAPCNPVEVEVPAHEAVADVGCHNGGKTVSERVDVATAGSS